MFFPSADQGLQGSVDEPCNVPHPTDWKCELNMTTTDSCKHDSPSVQHYHRAFPPFPGPSEPHLDHWSRDEAQGGMSGEREVRDSGNKQMDR